MAYVSTHPQSFFDRIVAAFRSMGDFIVLLGTADRRIAALERLTRMSDDDLAARGTTRQAELQRILGPRGVI